MLPHSNMSASKITPHVFISAVSEDLAEARQIVKNALLTIGCHPIVQEHFQPDYQSVRQMLKSRMEGCQAVIHLVGKRYGGEPNVASLAPGSPRRSWTQMEYDLAKELGIKLYLFYMDDSYPFDVRENVEPDDEVALQAAHRRAILTGEQFYTRIKEPDDLQLRVSEMKLEAAELRKIAGQNERRLFKTLGLIGGLLILIFSVLGLIKKDTGQLKSGQKTIVSNIEEIRQSFAGLANQAALITNPTTPEQYYHNARISELKGDYTIARKAYLEYFKFDIELLDPHLRFQQFLKVQEGIEGARQTYEALSAKSSGIVPRLAAILMWPLPERNKKLDAFVQSNPDFGPAYFLFSQDFSSDRLGTQSLEDKRREKQLIDQFNVLDGQGKVVRWMLDQSLVSEWRAEAATRLAALKQAGESLTNPIMVSWMGHNGGWTGNIQIGESAAEIFWKRPGSDQFESTGFSTARSVTTGKLMPLPTVQLPSNSGKLQLAVKYTNLNGEEMGPFLVDFDPEVESLSNTKLILSQTRTSWVSFRDYDGKILLYFSHLLSHRGGLKEIKYGLNKEIPDLSFSYPEFKSPGMAPIDNTVTIYLEVPADTKFATVQLTYRDGEKTSVERFDR